MKEISEILGLIINNTLAGIREKNLFQLIMNLNRMLTHAFDANC